LKCTIILLAAALDLLAKTLLDAPIGYVEQTVGDIIKRPVHLEVIEQNLIHETKYNRKIVIAFGQIPIVRASVDFDSKNIPKLVMTELLEKKKGIGSILQKHNISARRKTLRISVEEDGKKITRDCEVLHNNSVWFEITEEIRLDLLDACQNR
jgi:chorismate-pyruvate lyase